MQDVKQNALNVLSQNRVAVFIVAYNAERHIEQVLRRIPDWVAERLVEIYIIDDSSTDETIAISKQIEWPKHYAPLHIYRTPYNQGYGGNQRLGYLYAIEQGFDIVVLLHGDGQYAPEALPHILAQYATDADAVFGSRFLTTGGARKGGMPLYKFIGNRVLTWMQNRILGTAMSEMHSGYRSYRTSALQQIPFTHNALDFSFDADIIVQFRAAGLKIVEVPIPTFYGDEICRVNGMKYAWQCVKSALKYRLMQFEVFYDPKFDFRAAENFSPLQTPAVTSVQTYLNALPFPDNVKQLVMTRDTQLSKTQSYDLVFALDLLEHVAHPEAVANSLFQSLRSGGKLFTSTPNVAFLPLRLMLLVGWFNYSRRGILDMTHRRLFTVSAFCRLLRHAGFRIEAIRGFGPPLTSLPNGQHPILRYLHELGMWLARKWPRLFAYQVLVECTRTDAPDDLMKQMFPPSLEKIPTALTTLPDAFISLANHQASNTAAVKQRLRT